MSFDRQIKIDEIYDALEDMIETLDPAHLVPVYDMSTLGPKGNRHYSVVDSRWLYETWRKAYPDDPFGIMPHDHIGED